MKRHFKTVFFEEIRLFFKSIGDKATEKILWNIDLAEYCTDPRLFKKLEAEIWEFRTRYGNLQYRLLAFWDKTDPLETLVVATHGIIKKTDKVPAKEIDRALQARTTYFEQKIP
jgi:phage-related protein